VLDQFHNRQFELFTLESFWKIINKIINGAHSFLQNRQLFTIFHIISFFIILIWFYFFRIPIDLAYGHLLVFVAHQFVSPANYISYYLGESLYFAYWWSYSIRIDIRAFIELSSFARLLKLPWFERGCLNIENRYLKRSVRDLSEVNLVSSFA